MRINKLLSNYGYCSRKEANRWIEEGRITVNGERCQMGKWVEETDLILLDGQIVSPKEKVYLLCNKPVGITCTAEPDVKDNLIDFIGYPEYIFPVGRLDKDSQGLMFLTNDGDLANQVLASEHGHEKQYQVWVDRSIISSFIEGMASGVPIEGQMTKPCKLEVVEETGENTFLITLSQGLNRQIRKMCWHFGYKVIKLERLRIINLEMGTLPMGKWRHLTEEELMTLKRNLQWVNK